VKEEGSQQRKRHMQMWAEYESSCAQIEDYTLLGSVDKVPGICSEEKTDKWILHHDNALAHDVLRFREFLAKKFITKKIDHPPYSSDLTPCDFCLFRKLKNGVKAQSSTDISDIQRKETT
jgi:hypothetical protein